MKNIVLILIISLSFASCGSPSGHADTAATSVGTASKGEGLMASSDCNTCHKADTKLVGPSCKDIAGKYSLADTDKLAGKITNGGSGVWGDIPMTPHPGITPANAKAMVTYILTQK
jgi:cytochrome c